MSHEPVETKNGGEDWNRWHLNLTTFKYDCNFCSKSFVNEGNAYNHWVRELNKERKAINYQNSFASQFPVGNL